MDRQTRVFLRLLTTALLSALALFGACTCEDDYTYPSTDLERGLTEVDNAVRMRFTQTGLDFMQTNFKEILVGVLGDPDETDPDNLVLLFNEPLALDTGFSFLENVLPVIGANDLDVSQATEVYPTRLYMDEEAMINNLTLEFLDGDRDGFRMRIENIPFGMRGRIFTKIPQAACDMYGNNPEPYMTEITVEALIYLDVGHASDCEGAASECLLLDIEIPDDGIDLGDIDDSSVAFSKAEDSAHCTSSGACSGTCDNFWASISIAGGWTAGVLHDLMQPVLDEIMTGILELLLADIDGTPVGGGTLFDIGSAGEGLLKPTIHNLGLMAVPTGNAFDVTCPEGHDCEVHRGMDLTLKSGAEAVPKPNALYGSPHACVPPVEFHDFERLYGEFDFSSKPAPDLLGSIDGVPYHLGMSLSRTSMNQVLFAAYHTGALCLEIESSAITAMTGGAFTLSAGTVDLLTEGRLRQYVSPSAPALLALVPSEPPVFHLEQSEEQTGTIRVTWDDLRIDFYVWMHGHYSRVFGVKTDVDIGLKLFYDNEGRTIHLAIADGIQIENFEQVYNELLPEVNFNEILETLIGVALDAVLGSTEFEFPIGELLAESAGVPIGLTLQSVTVDPSLVDETLEFLNLYLSMTEVELPTEGESPEGLSQPWQLSLTLDGPQGLFEPLPLPTLGAQDALVLPTGQVSLRDLSGQLSTSHAVYIRVDFGLLQGPFFMDEEGVLLLENHKLKLVGKHHMHLWIEGRDENNFSRVVHQTDFQFWVDPYAPTVEFVKEQGQLWIMAEDQGTAADDIEMRWRTPQQDWSGWAPVAPLSLDWFDDCSVDIQLRDLAGNWSPIKRISLCAEPEQMSTRTISKPTRSVDVISQGCQQMSPHFLSWMGLWAFLWVGFTRRRSINRYKKTH